VSHLKNKVILVTGGTSGIGLACTEFFARHGAKVVTMSIQAEEGQALANRLTGEGLDCVFHYGDVSKEPEVKAAVDLALSKFGRLDCVHANAGLMRNQKITDLTLDDFHAMVNVNLLGPVLVAKHAIPIMERQGKGVICITTSVAAEIGFPGHGIYCATKAGLVALIRCLATDHSPKGIRFVGVSPGTIDTPMLAASCAGWSKSKEEIYADVAKKIPVQRMGQPIDVANAVGFLLSDDSGFINGSIVHLEGGTLCLPPW
jgi:NAD(P)-dependent dehydrogenase (short-subunit alcohol dehydrogenase family)